MPKISLKNVSLDFPLYDAESRSLTHSMTSALPIGGRIRRGGDGKRPSVLALDDVTLEFKEGDRVAIFGHNGAGKTTMLKLLSGFYEPTSGTIHRQGKVSVLLNLMAGLDLNMSGYDNIILGGMLHGLRRKEVMERIDAIAEFSDLGAYLNMPVRLYSSGMVLRLAFSICTSVDSEILLLDEWVGAGDKAFLEKTHERLSDMVSRSSILVFASHDTNIAERLCDKAIFLHHGKALFHGDIHDVLQRYMEKFQQTV